jgi:hypothetical protein
MGMVFKNIEYMNGGVLKISTVRLYPKVWEESPPPGYENFSKRGQLLTKKADVAGL